MSLLDCIHGRIVYPRRLGVLSSLVSALLPLGTSVLDLGCGDGRLAASMLRLRPDLRVTGVAVLLRPKIDIPVQEFDGQHLPFPDRSFDVVMIVDVLHHTADPLVILAEAGRVARSHLIVKDHNCNGILARLTLRLMDYVGNAWHGVALPYNFWTREQWRQAFQLLGFNPASSREVLHLYPWPASWLFDRSLHFLARLDKV